jgi:predicted Zn-dependent protease
VRFQKDPTRTEGNCFAATGAQIADSKTASTASGMWAVLARHYKELDDPAEAERCKAKAVAFYARYVELEVGLLG